MSEAAEVELDDKELRKFIRDLSKNVKNPETLTEMVSAFSAIVFRDVIDHFAKEDGPDGAWPEWSKAYARNARKAGRSKKLQWNGRLRNTFRPEMRRYKDGAFQWFNNAKTKGGYPYAWGHNSGDGKLPQREFMWLSDKAFDKMTDIVWDYMAEGGD